MIKEWIVEKYNKIFHKNSYSKQQTDEYIGSLSFKLTSNSEIDLEYVLPDITNKSIQEMSYLAEQYAEFLMAINEGYLRDEILSIMNKKADTTRDSQEKLFWDNIISFWAMLHIEVQQEKKNRSKSEKPLIRPLSTFNKSEEN
jgi:hypothetical protein